MIPRFFRKIYTDDALFIEDNKIDLVILFRIIFKKNRFLLINTIIAIVLAFIYLFTATPWYTATVTVLPSGADKSNLLKQYSSLIAISGMELPMKNLLTGEKSSDPFKELFNFISPGYNIRPIEMSGAIGIEQIKKLDDFIQHRRRNTDYFIEEMADKPDFIIQEEIGKSSWFGFSFIIPTELPLSRKDIIKLLGDHGIATRPIVSGNFTKNPIMKFYRYEIHGELKNAQLLHDRGFFVGNLHFDL